MFRLYDPKEGKVYLDGQELSTLTFSFRKHFSFISQSPYLFNGTVLENLTYGNPEVTKEEIIELAKRLEIH